MSKETRPDKDAAGAQRDRNGSLESERDDENIISLNEYIEAENDLEDDARAVLGGSDANNCTYDQVDIHSFHTVRWQWLIRMSQ